MTPAQENDRQIDAQLLARIATGDEVAFGSLYDRFSPGLFSFVLRMTRDEKEAEDVLQEGFAQTLAARGHLRSGAQQPVHLGG
ncbi:MAG: sigma factor [Chthoniobacter sp.]